MIAYVEGRLLEKTSSSCIVVTNGGIGYEIGIPVHTLSKLKNQGDMVSFYTCFVVREDAQELFGFETWDERETFIILTSINRVGARTALSILSAYRPDDLRRIILEDDVNALTLVSGIGKKSAQQIFLELKYKLKADSASITTVSEPSILKDAVTGLVNLGYDETQADTIIREVLKNEPDCDVSSALRAGLKLLAKKK